MKTANKFRKDKKLEEFFEEVRKKEFPWLSIGNINYIFRSKTKLDKENRVIIGTASVLSPRERDLYGYDFQICIDETIWSIANKEEKEQIAWHELNHLIIKTTKNGEELYNSADRIKIAVRPHDIVIKTFAEEIRKFGPMKPEEKAITIMSKYIKKKESKSRKLRRRKKNDI